jgi:hypothetical protein
MYVYKPGPSRPAQLDAALLFDRFDGADRKISPEMGHGHNSRTTRMGEVMVATSRSHQSPAFRFDSFDDIPALQISPIARMLVRPDAPTMT